LEMKDLDVQKLFSNLLSLVWTLQVFMKLLSTQL